MNSILEIKSLGSVTFPQGVAKPSGGSQCACDQGRHLWAENLRTELTKVESRPEPRPEKQSLWSAKGQATAMNTVTQTGPRWKAPCPEWVSAGSPCEGDADSGSRGLGQSTRTACEFFSFQKPGFLRADVVTSKPDDT